MPFISVVYEKGGFKLYLRLILFLNLNQLKMRTDRKHQWTFPETLSNVMLKLEVYPRFGLKSKSFGKGDDRHLTISKKFDPMR